MGRVQNPFDPAGLRVMFEPFLPPRIHEWTPETGGSNRLGIVLEWGETFFLTSLNVGRKGAHYVVHDRVGGHMADLNHAPEAPIFWPWHSFIDDIYQSWLDRFGVPTEWGGLGTHGMDGIVPACTGKPLHVAKGEIGYAGLVVGKEWKFQHHDAPVVWQDPMPGTRLQTSIGKVDLSGTNAWPDKIVPQCVTNPPMLLQRARDLIENHDLEVALLDFGSNSPSALSVVKSQRPAAGTVRPGDNKVHLGARTNSV